MTISQKIQAAQALLIEKKDRLTELDNAETRDTVAITEVQDQVEAAAADLASLERSERLAGINAGSEQRGPAAPAINRVPLSRGRDLSGMDILVRAITAAGISHFGKQPLERVLEQRYDNHVATTELAKIMARADQTIGTTTVSGWASELVQTVNQGFMDALMPFSIYPSLRAKGIGLNFDGVGNVVIPGRTAGGAGGGFVGEGAPIRVGRITTTSISMSPKKLGVIVAFSRELAKRSTPAIEALVRQAILEDTGVILDGILIDSGAATSVRPAGLLNGVSALTAFGGTDYLAVIADFKALMAPFVTANAVDQIVVLMNPTQGFSIALMPGPDGVIGSFMGPIRDRVTFIESTTVPAGTLIALRAADFVTALGDAPEFDVSEQATIHMEDTTALEVVSGTGPTTADPVRSLWQTASIGVRMIQDVSWKMRRSGMVQYITGVAW